MANEQIIRQYSGVFNQPTESLNGDGANARILILKEGKTTVAWTGSEFSEEEFEKRMAKEYGGSKAFLRNSPPSDQLNS